MFVCILYANALSLLGFTRSLKTLQQMAFCRGLRTCRVACRVACRVRIVFPHSVYLETRIFTLLPFLSIRCFHVGADLRIRPWFVQHWMRADTQIRPYNYSNGYCAKIMFTNWMTSLMFTTPSPFTSPSAFS